MSNQHQNGLEKLKELQEYAEENSLRLNKYQEELIEYTMKLSNVFLSHVCFITKLKFQVFKS